MRKNPLDKIPFSTKKVYIFFITPLSLHYGYGLINVLKFHTLRFLTKWHMQSVQIQIRLLKEQSDQGLHYLPFHLIFLTRAVVGQRSLPAGYILYCNIFIIKKIKMK